MPDTQDKRNAFTQVNQGGCGHAVEVGGKGEPGEGKERREGEDRG